MSRSGFSPNPAGAPNSAIELGQELARGRRRRLARFEEFRPRVADRSLPSGALARRVGALGGRLGLGGQRRDALVEPGRARVEVLAPFADLGREQPRAAQEKVRELERAPEVERDRQRAEEIQNHRGSIEPVAVRRNPVGHWLQPVAGAPSRVERRLAVEQPNEESEHEGDDSPQDETRLAAVGPYRSNHDRGAPASSERRHVAHEIAIARVDIRAGESEPTQPRLDRSPARAGEDVEARARGVRRERIRKPRALGLDVVALSALGFELPYKIVMTI